MSEEKRLVLILGGARSGKSSFAVDLAKQRGTRVLFAATAEPGDDAMSRRIEAHRRDRPAGWRTVEAPTNPAAAIAEHAGDAEVVILDCLTLLASNILIREAGDDPEAEVIFQGIRRRLEAELSELVKWFQANRAHLIVVSNELGLGLVPPNPLGRAYRDLLGWANQRLAARADEVYFLVAGLPLDLKRVSLAGGFC